MLWKKIIGLIDENKMIISIIIVGFIFRIYGIYFDYPLGVNSIWDESYNMSYVLNLFHYKSFLSAFGPYPIFLPLLYIPVVILRIFYLMIINHLNSVGDIYNFLIANGMGYINIVARWYSVFFGTATIYLVYKISRQVYKSALSGYFSAAAYAVSLVAIFLAHWGKVHIAMVFFIILSLYFALIYEETKKKKFFYFSVLASALSIGIHELGVTSIIFPISALVLNWRQIGLKTTIRSFFLALSAIIIFYVPNIKGISNMYLRDSGKIAGNNFMGMFPTGPVERFYYIFRDAILVEPVFIALFIIVLLFAGKKLWRNINARYVLIGLAFNYFLMSTVFASPLIIRWLAAFITLAIILAAGYIPKYLNGTKLKPYAVSILLLALLMPGIYFSCRWDMLLNNYTRNELVEWLENNLHADEIAYAFDLYIDAPLSYEAAKWHVEDNKIAGSKKLEYILSHQAEFADRGLNLFFDSGNSRYKDLARQKTKYAIIYYWESGLKNKRYDDARRTDAEKILENLKQYHTLSLRKTFYPTDNKELIASGVNDFLNNPLELAPLINLDKSGPFIEVYEIKS